jgi:ADP-ribose pyrophosphatase YjhB (NUDIX family)
MRPTGLDSDVFKFHLRKLVHQKLVEKQSDGQYALTLRGKEFANNLSRTDFTVQKQPKLSVAIIAKKQTSDGVVYLFQKRQRNPYYGFWGILTGPIQWGEQIEETAKREFEKQTGLSAMYKIQSFYRKTDYEKDTRGLLEDKLFVVIEATDIRGEITNKWAGGFNAWMSISELENQPKYFASSHDLIQMAQPGKKYSSEKAFYKRADY